MIKPLVWKEWHEQRWKLAFGTVMLAFFTGSLIAARLTTDNENIVAVLFLGGLILSLYSAMGVFAPETTDRTKTFLSSKPIQPWKVFLCKWFFGWMNFAVPILICGLGMGMITIFKTEWPSFELKHLSKSIFAGVMFATIFYSMACCFAPRKSSEASVGFTGLIICLLIFAHILIVEFTLFHGLQHQQSVGKLRELILFINPFMWLHFIKPVYGLPKSTFLIEQGILFIIVISVGLRKWQRSS